MFYAFRFELQLRRRSQIPGGSAAPARCLLAILFKKTNQAFDIGFALVELAQEPA
jgi:hypothetical protein